MRCPICDGSLSETAVIRGSDRLLGVPGEFTVSICRSCQGGVTFPIASDREMSQYYPASYAPYEALSPGIASLVSKAIQRWQAWRDFRSVPLRVLETAGPGSVLDVGCGRGDLGAALIKRGWRVTGVEPSPEATEVARRRGIDAHAGTLADVELEPGSQDAVIFQHSLEHVPNPAEALARAAESLRSGGLLIVTVPNFGSWQRRRFGSAWFHLDLPRHRAHFTGEGLTGALRRAGFEVDEVSTSTTPVGLPGSVQYRLFGRCVFTGGMQFRLASAGCAVLYPLIRLADRLRGEGDVLHAVARKA